MTSETVQGEVGRGPDGSVRSSEWTGTSDLTSVGPDRSSVDTTSTSSGRPDGVSLGLPLLSLPVLLPQ